MTVNSLYFEDQSIVRKIVSTFGSQAVCLSLDVKKLIMNIKFFTIQEIQSQRSLLRMH